MMARRFTTAALASAAVFGVLVMGTAGPAEAAKTPVKKPAPVQGTLAQIAAGTLTVKPGDTGPAITDIQVRLNNIGITTPTDGTYSSDTEDALIHFQWKFFLDESGLVSRSTAKQLLAISAKGMHVPAVCKTKGKTVCVDMTQKVLRLYKDGKVLKTIDARFGGPGNETHAGLFRVFEKRLHDYSQLYKTPMPYSAYFDGGRALHYSMYFDAQGYNGASHGCINIGSRAEAKYVFNFVRIGTRVKVYR
ncbi:MAG: L,D-transpeptidase family protein [Actinomycetes bacterium]